MTESEVSEVIELIEKDLKLHSKDLSSKYKNGLRMAINALEKQKTMECLLEKATEEIENIYGRETELSEEIRDLLDDLN